MPAIAEMVNLLVILLFLAFLAGGFAILYHLSRFGIGTLPKRLSGLFLVGALLLFSASLALYLKLDLSTLLP